jgi:hypothetical protein
MGLSFLSAKAEPIESEERSDNGSIIDSGSLQYTAEGGQNSSKLTYQEASGAPVEVNSPLGYSVGSITVVFLNLSKMIGTGVFSTRMSASIPSVAPGDVSFGGI